MKLKLLAIAFAASFALTACDSSSTSSDANEPVSENSNPGQDQQTTEVKKIPPQAKALSIRAKPPQTLRITKKRLKQATVPTSISKESE